MVCWAGVQRKRQPTDSRLEQGEGLRPGGGSDVRQPGQNIQEGPGICYYFIRLKIYKYALTDAAFLKMRLIFEIL